MTSRLGPTRVGVVLPEVLAEHGVKEQVERMEVLHLWEGIVGEHVAKVSRARAVDGSTLVVEVRSSAWLMELSMMKDDFLTRVNARLGAVPLERIVFVLAQTE